MPQRFCLIFCILFIFLLPYTSATNDPENLHKATNETLKKTEPIFDSLIATFVVSMLISIATCIMLWWTFFYLYSNLYRIMWSLEEKLRVATRRLSDRKLGDDIMAQMRKMAPYDATQNNQEISTMLKSVYQSQNKQLAPP